MIKFNDVTERAARQFFLLALFFVPFSTALMNVFVAVTYLACLLALSLNGQLRESLRESIKFIPSILAILLFVLFLLGITWSIAPPNEIETAVGKYAKLFLIPLGIALAWRDSTLARRAIIWFMAGATFLACSSYLTRLNLMPTSSRDWWSVGTTTNAVAFKNHITFGIMLGFSALICFRYYFYASSTYTRLFSIAMGLFFAVPIIFFTQGRTGYIVFLVGLLMLAILRFSANLKMLTVSMVTVVAIFVSFYAMSDNLKQRTDHLVSEVEGYSASNELNSSGTRLSYYRAGLQLIAEHPLVGLGTGSFQEGFAPTAKKLWPEGDPFHTARHQPHSEVILIGVQLGMAGWIVYFSLLAWLIWAARKANSFEGDSLLILCVIFAIAGIFNSLLWDVAEGHWLTLLAGCLYAQTRRSSADVS
jgi:O-antigen ligase